MNCADFEILLCDYMDGTLESSRKQEFEEHLRECATCAEMARDVQGAVAFIERAEEVQMPPELLTRITFAIPASKAPKGFRSWFAGPLQTIFQPRFAMGMAMTILSFSMLGRFAGIEVRQLKPSDLTPTKIWAAADDKVHRTWQRAVKYYDNLKLVYEVQTRLSEWTDREEQQPAPTQTQTNKQVQDSTDSSRPLEGKGQK
jgi:anti-sigma factor RsiW